MWLDPLLPLAPLLDPVLDPLVVRLGHAAIGVLRGPPLRARHAAIRERALETMAERRSTEVAPSIEGVRAHEPEAIARFDALVAAAVDELRGEAEARVAVGTYARLVHAVDCAMVADAPEWLDDPSFDAALRVRTLDRLDRMNELLGSYDAFFAVLAPIVERARASGVARPLIVDLASGHAMFAVRMALRFGAREGLARVVATDLRPEYLELGRAEARRLGMGADAIDFLAQDALDLHALPARLGAPVDVVCCTQSVHHFAPGLVARMLGEATAIARHAAVIIDGERNLFALGLVALASGLLGRGNVPFAHDALVSLRRMYTEQELALIARLAPGVGRVGLEHTRGWKAPGHAWVAARGAAEPPLP